MRTPEELRKAYEAGATVEELTLEEGTYPGKMRRILKAAGTEFRKPGQRKGTKAKHNIKNEPRADRPTGVHRLKTVNSNPTRFTGKRRRGGL